MVPDRLADGRLESNRPDEDDILSDIAEADW
jgi:hypothetical protein